MRRPRHSLTVQARLTLVYTGLVLVAGIAVVAIGYALTARSLERQPRNSDDLVAEVAEALGTDPETLEKNGGLLGSAASGEIHPPIDRPLLPDGRSIRDLFEEIEADTRDQALDQFLTQSLIGLGVVALTAAAMGWLIARRVLHPVRRITRAARHASEHNLHDRIGLPGPRDELTELADTFDDLLGRLEVAFAAQRSFAADVSHELRTPITVIRAEADLALGDPAMTDRERALAQNVNRAAARCERVIDSLLAMARSAHHLTDRHPVDFAGLVGDIVGEQVADATAAGLSVDLDLHDAVVTGDATLLERLVHNLVRNAIVHNHPDGHVDVAIRTDRDRVLFEVANTGPIVAGDAVERLFRPFQRDTRTEGADGVGLGLSLAVTITAAHGGTLEAVPRPGGGLRIIVSLPSGSQDHPDPGVAVATASVSTSDSDAGTGRTPVAITRPRLRRTTRPRARLPAPPGQVRQTLHEIGPGRDRSEPSGGPRGQPATIPE
jgi:signal transduction histidine kinase